MSIIIFPIKLIFEREEKSLVNKIWTLTPYQTARTVGEQVDEKKIQARVSLGPSTAESQRGKTLSMLLGQREMRQGE